jgi:predicted DNA-binding protein
VHAKCMCMLTHRLQLLLDDERYERVHTLARQRGTSVAAVIREALDRGLPATQRRRSAAARRILAAELMPVGNLLTELDDLRGRHA